MENDRQDINAVHERDLENVLRKINQYEKLVNGELKCKFSDDVITFENLHSIIPNPDGFSFVCSKPECVKALAEYLEERHKGKIG